MAQVEVFDQRKKFLDSKKRRSRLSQKKKPVPIYICYLTICPLKMGCKEQKM
jgi:hypothetical protein